MKIHQDKKPKFVIYSNESIISSFFSVKRVNSKKCKSVHTITYFDWFRCRFPYFIACFAVVHSWVLWLCCVVLII